MSVDFFRPLQESVLDLPIQGSIGEFSVRSQDRSAGSVRVQYIQTHIGFAVGGDAEERLLQQLAPVREVFNVSELGFEDLMQRDIDDARVSTDLIPYLLQESGEALVKLFPPIIVVVLPTNSLGRPAALYPRVQEFTIEDEKHANLKWRILRSGEIGSEAFEFKQMEIPNRSPDAHNYAQLRLNTTGCKLAIVDGQHRAMALLALYRNWKQWPENTLQYRDYYKRWARGVIERFDLSGIRLPLMLCTFPDLHEGNSGAKLKVTEACRSIFLALNKNARPVTKARNYLLNDDDIIAHFLRKTLEHVKEYDATSQSSLRLWNVELDSDGDRRALTAPMAISGVMHLYGLIEFLMLNTKWDGQYGLPKQNLWKKKALGDCIRRLEAKAALGSERCERAKRSLIEKDTAKILCDAFWQSYGRIILRCLDSFRPYRVHNTCALALEARLGVEANGSTYHAILFEGQGIGRVFEDYVERLREERRELSDSLGGVPPALEATFSEFEQKGIELNNVIAAFNLHRTETFFRCLSKAHASEVDVALRDLYRNTFTTEAFQLALVISFFSTAEAARDEAVRNGESLALEDVELAFSEYMDQLNRFFTPESPKEAWDIFRVFYGEVKGGHTTPAEVIKSTTCLRRILIPGELKPDEWPKFRYIFLELWKPSYARFSVQVDQQRTILRKIAASLYEDRELDQVAKRKGVHVSDLPEGSVRKVTADSKETFCRALKAVGVNIVPEDLADRHSVNDALEELATEDDSVDEEDGEADVG
jgi:hypothetical protein